MRKKRLFVLFLTLLIAFAMCAPVTANAATLNQKVKVAKKAKKYRGTVKVGTKIKLKVYSGKKKLSYKKCKFTTSKKSVATVTKKGVITAKKAGTATITVKYGKKKAKLYLTVRRVTNRSTSGGSTGSSGTGTTGTGGNTGTTGGTTGGTTSGAGTGLNADGTYNPEKIVWSAADKARFQNVPYGYNSSTMTPGWHKVLMPVVGYPNGAGIAGGKYWNRIGTGKYTMVTNACEYNGVDYLYDTELEMSRGVLISWTGFYNRLIAKYPGVTSNKRIAQGLESGIVAGFTLDTCKKYNSATDFVTKELFPSKRFENFTGDAKNKDIWLFWASEVDSWTRQWNGKTVHMRWQYFLYGNDNPMGYDYGPFTNEIGKAGYYGAATAVDCFEAISDEVECWLYVPA